MNLEYRVWHPCAGTVASGITTLHLARQERFLADIMHGTAEGGARIFDSYGNDHSHTRGDN